jgi:hypothetical protein
LRAHGLSDQQWRVLRVLREHEQRAGNRAQLAQQAYLLGPSLTGMLGRMEKSDAWVTRERSPEDARRSLVRGHARGPGAGRRACRASIQAQYADLAGPPGARRTWRQLYTLLDELIALPAHADAEWAEEMLET